MGSRYDGQKEIAGKSLWRDSWVGADKDIRITNNPHGCQLRCGRNMRQSFLKGSLHLFGCRLRGNLRGHVVQVLPKILGVPAVLLFKGACHDMGKVALGRHTGGARLRFKRGCVLLRQVNSQVHTLLLRLTQQSMPGAPEK